VGLSRTVTVALAMHHIQMDFVRVIGRDGHGLGPSMGWVGLGWVGLGCE